MENVKAIIDGMSLEEKLRLLAGRDSWHMESVESAGLPSIMLTDGPHGLRKQKEGSIGLNESVPSTCFPPACLTAAGWDVDNAEAEGAAIGEECAAEGVSILLGPGTNIKRSPLCGRNFEYYSEDPYLAGKLASAFIRGVERKGIGTSLKHFAANNQEKARLSSNSVIDERALREIYLKPFEIAVKEARPSTLMCSYNMINGVYSSDNRWLLSDVLRDEWGFDGFVMSDWGAVSDRVKAVLAGLDLEMPGPSPDNRKALEEALRRNELSIEDIDRCVSRLVSFILKSRKVEKEPYSAERHHSLASHIASSSFVLLENDSSLPLQKDGKYALIGSFAEKPRYQGAGSSKIVPTRLDDIRSSLRSAGVSFDYAPGYSVETGETDEAMIAEALEKAGGKDAAVVIIGLPDSYESEGFDRHHMDLPSGQLRVIDALLEKGIRVIAAVLAGSPVIMPFRKKVSSLLYCYLGGQALGSALADVLTGKVSPSGKLPETFPLSLEDTPCYGSFATEDRNVRYRESIFTGYRYYDWAGKEVAYPFGYGLSYTSFSFSGLTVTEDKVSVKVRNTGKRSGSEVVQLYIGMRDSRIMRAVRELKGFHKVYLEPGEERMVDFFLDRDCFSYFDTVTRSFEVEKGTYIISVGNSSRNILCSSEIAIDGIEPHGVQAERGKLPPFEALFDGPVPYIAEDGEITMNTPIHEVLRTEAGKAVLGPIVEEAEKTFSSIGGDLSAMMLAMLYDMPLRGISMNTGMRASEIYRKIKEYRGKQ